MRLRRHRAVWVIALLVATAATIVGLWAVTKTVRDLEDRQSKALDEIARAETIRMALWRMDSWMTPRLAREAARPIAEYSAFYAPSGTVNRLLQSVPKGEVLSPSPLLLATPDWIPIYFETQADGTLTSPQIPEGNLLDLASGKYISPELLKQREAALDDLRASIAGSPRTLDACASSAEFANIAAEVSDAKDPVDDLASRARASNEAQSVAQQAQAEYDWKVDAPAEVNDRAAPAMSKMAPSRQMPPPPSAPPPGVGGEIAALKADIAALKAAHDEEMMPVREGAPVSTSSIGPFVPTWLSITPPRLVFVRRVQEGTATRLQGFLVDWPKLSIHLVAQITDLAVDPRLVPTLVDAGSFGPARLASIPADLVADSYVTNVPQTLATSATAVRFAWAAAILALLGAGAAAVAGVTFGDRQARFASSVTHELRTPLTTFQLYAEMLRDDMIPDAARRQECLATLCRESKRLSHLVENVLSLARVERGAQRRQDPTLLASGELARIVRAISEERAGGSTISISDELGSASLTIDRDALSQILANLIENAAKYGRSADGTSTIDIALSREGTTLVLGVRDHGAGIAPRQEAAIWRPFDRAGAEGSNQPGLGLGLAVSRALAEGMRGTLQLSRASAATGSTPTGAHFELRIPAVVAPA